MKITINYNISHPDTDLLCIDEKISMDDFHGTEEESTILLKTTRAIKDICRDYEKNYI